MNYPNKIIKQPKKVISYANRGMALEEELNDSNSFYLEQDRALIYKKPTPIGISKASYTEHGRRIDEGYFLAQSTLDYNGIYKGRYIEFDAKETLNKTSFPLANIHAHQITHIKRVHAHGGIVFLLIRMNGLIYLLPGKTFINFLNETTRKSIPYSFLEEHGVLIKEKINPAIDYLEAVDKIYFKGE